MRNSFSKKLDDVSLAVLDMCDYYGEGMIITRINVPSKHRSKGVASELLQQACDQADQLQHNLFLEILASDGLTYDQLAAWYERYGFHDIGGVWKRRPKKS